MTKEQWIGVLDFVKAMDAKLLISVSNCAKDHPDGGPLDLTQAKKIFEFSHKYGVDINAAEFMNEPNMLPVGYTAADYVRDHDIFNKWVRENYPQCLLVGPCTIDSSLMGQQKSAGIGDLIGTCSTEELLNGAQIPLDVFSYHYYNGVSERLASLLPNAHWDASQAHTDAYLAVAPNCAKIYSKLRDKYVSGGKMWVTESGDAGGGGNTWASTYLDVLRTLNELGSFATVTDGVIFHNTLASSDYGFLKHGTFEPRPNYFAVFLWNKLMGTTVYDCDNPDTEGAHVYCHSRRDGNNGYAYLIINNSLTEETEVEIFQNAEIYTLSGNGDIRSSAMLLNGKELTDTLSILPLKSRAGRLRLAPATCTFIIL